MPDRPNADHLPVPLDYRSPDSAPPARFNARAWFAAWVSVVAAVVQFVWICVAPMIVLFHGSDAATGDHVTRLGRLWFVTPGLLSLTLSLLSLKARGSWHHRPVAGLGLAMGLLALLLVTTAGFSR